MPQMLRRKPDDKKTMELNKILAEKVAAEAEAEGEDEDALLEGEAAMYPRIASEVAEFSTAVARVIELTEERRDCTRNEACETLEKLLSILHGFGYVNEYKKLKRDG